MDKVFPLYMHSINQFFCTYILVVTWILMHNLVQDMLLIFWFYIVTNLNIIMGCLCWKTLPQNPWRPIEFEKIQEDVCLVSCLKKLNLDKMWRRPIELNWVPYHKSSLSLLLFWFYSCLSYYLVILKVRIWIYIKIQSWLCMNLPIGYLSNIKCNFMKSFHYHDNIL